MNETHYLTSALTELLQLWWLVLLCVQPLHTLEIWLNKILSQLRQHKQDASWMYEMTENMSYFEARFSTKMSYYQMYWQVW